MRIAAHARHKCYQAEQALDHRDLSVSNWFPSVGPCEFVCEFSCTVYYVSGDILGQWEHED